MANNEKNEKNVNNEEKAVVNELPKEVAQALETEKKSFWGKLGKGMKIGLGALGVGLTVGVTWLVVHLLKGNDDNESEEAETEAPADE